MDKWFEVMDLMKDRGSSHGKMLKREHWYDASENSLSGYYP